MAKRLCIPGYTGLRWRQAAITFLKERDVITRDELFDHFSRMYRNVPKAVIADRINKVMWVWNKTGRANIYHSGYYIDKIEYVPEEEEDWLEIKRK